MFDRQVNSKVKHEGSQRGPSGSPANPKKPSFTTSFDDLSLIFGGKLFKFIDFYHGEVILLSTFHFVFFLLQKLPSHLNSRKWKVKLKKEEKRDWDVIREHKRERCVLFFLARFAEFLLVRGGGSSLQIECHIFISQHFL